MSTMTATTTMARPRTATARVAHGSPRPASPVLRLTRRGRLVITVLFVALGLGFSLARATAGEAQTSQGPAYRTITVAPGQTLWGIAGSVTAGADRHDTVEALIQLNRLTTHDIPAGQTLRVPVSH